MAAETVATLASRSLRASTQARSARQAARDEDLARRGNRDRQGDRGLHRALLEREPALAVAGIAAQRVERPGRREIQLPARVQRPSAEDGLLGECRAQQVGHLRVERSAGATPDRRTGAADPVDDPPAVDRKRGGEAPAELEHDERSLLVGNAKPARLVRDAQRGAADLVGGPEVDAVPLAVLRHRGQVDRARAEDQRQSGVDEGADHRPHAAYARPRARLVAPKQQHERQLALADPLARNERQPVAGGAEHEVEGAVSHERIDERCRVERQIGRPEALVEQHLAAVERAHIDGDGPGVHASDPRTGRRLRRSLGPRRRRHRR